MNNTGGRNYAYAFIPQNDKPQAPQLLPDPQETRLCTALPSPSFLSHYFLYEEKENASTSQA